MIDPVGAQARRGAPASSIHDVARAAGVSAATVSRALRGLPRVNAQTRARVLEAAEALRYVASPTAASLASGRTMVVGVVVPFLSRWFFAKLIDNAEKVLRQSGYHVLLFNVGPSGPSRTVMLNERLLAKRVDAVIVLSADLEPREVALLGDLNRPVVTVGVDIPAWSRVGIDDTAVARTAVRHLIGLGHTRIGYLGGDPAQDVSMATAIHRRAGFLDGLEAAGLRPEVRAMLVGDWTIAGGVAVGDGLLALSDPPTAVVCASDEMAIGLLYAARQRGVAVPAELSVVGIDDHEMSFTCDLTTVAQPVSEQGCTAARLVLDAMSGTRPARRRDVVLPTRLVVRGTTAPLPGSSGRASEVPGRGRGRVGV